MSIQHRIVAHTQHFAMSECNGDFVSLNVGGQLFATSLATLTRHPESMLAAMFSGRVPTSKDASGNCMIDRDPTHFRLILNYLRDGSCALPTGNSALEEMLVEANFYQINSLCELIRETKAVTPNGLQARYIEVLNEAGYGQLRNWWYNEVVNPSVEMGERFAAAVVSKGLGDEAQYAWIVFPGPNFISNIKVPFNWSLRGVAGAVGKLRVNVDKNSNSNIKIPRRFVAIMLYLLSDELEKGGFPVAMENDVVCCDLLPLNSESRC